MNQNHFGILNLNNRYIYIIRSSKFLKTVNVYSLLSSNRLFALCSFAPICLWAGIDCISYHWFASVVCKFWHFKIISQPFLWFPPPSEYFTLFYTIWYCYNCLFACLLVCLYVLVGKVFFKELIELMATVKISVRDRTSFFAVVTLLYIYEFCRIISYWCLFFIDW